MLSLSKQSPPPIHIAVDVRFAALDTRGIGRYTRTLLNIFRQNDDVRLTYVAAPLFAPRRRIAEALGVAPSHIVRRVPDDAIVWSPSNSTDLRGGRARVTTVHDVAPFIFPAPNLRIRGREQEPLEHTAVRADRILAPSTYDAAEIIEHLHIPADRIIVTPEGYTASIFHADGEHMRLPDGRTYVLHVGAHDERKNVGTLIAGWQQAFPDAAVALAFTRKPEALPSGAIVLDVASDEALAAAYRGAAMVAVPSLHEGFGLPLLEAMACGAPVVAAYASALPELGGDAVRWVNAPRDVAAWSAALRALAEDDAERARLAAAGIERAAPFTWQRCADQTLGAIASLLR
jgi:glycosyltransferase involved in cell wall biosynthesis